ncbi:MAG: SprT family zinc-dependent metalloprotease [Firmicutes bacterium]|nr:SprT family zinc-dependent metalloprotease [Bacillota bacterium]
MDFKIIRSQRKSIGIIVGANEVVVRAPHYLSDEEIKLELKDHQLWISEKVSEQEKKNRIVDKYLENGIFLFRGIDLKVVKTEGKKIFVDGEYIYIGIDSKIDIFLKKELDNIIEELIIKWSHINKPTSITYRKQKTIWGSCTIKGKINLNIKLAKAPIEVIEYIYIHELVHLEIRNHSRTFWDRLEAILPNYRKSKRWLKDNGHLIGRDFMVK